MVEHVLDSAEVSDEDELEVEGPDPEQPCLAVLLVQLPQAADRVLGAAAGQQLDLGTTRKNFCPSQTQPDSF